ncbi:hypothetical protein Kisp02_62760 [Kineosporia sp. NBRC 101731]|nr:hypothetical protein Kisp02_62760 [Kineosporia sp. NBRC 101731]
MRIGGELRGDRFGTGPPDRLITRVGQQIGGSFGTAVAAVVLSRMLSAGSDPAVDQMADQ